MSSGVPSVIYDVPLVTLLPVSSFHRYLQLYMLPSGRIVDHLKYQNILKYLYMYKHMCIISLPNPTSTYAKVPSINYFHFIHSP